MLHLRSDMNCHSSIPVVRTLGNSLHTREAAEALVQCAAKHPCDQIELDFEGVDFISRSFAHQFHFDKIIVAKESKKVIIVTNANESVLLMLQTVAKEKVRKHSDYNTPIYKFDRRAQMERMLLGF